MMVDNGADPAFVPAASSREGVSTKGFNPGEGYECGPNFAPEDGRRECYYCGRMLHAECEAWRDA